LVDSFPFTFSPIYASGLYSSRRIAKACRERNDFVMIVALDPPDFRTISDFRKRHLKALGALGICVHGVYPKGDFLSPMTGAALESTLLKASFAPRNSSQSHPVFAGGTHRSFSNGT
jgi:hypothetical protein